ncbi:TPR repeat-containing protein [Lutibacter oricola]|uniref:TPR repeat-containing protein n=1 Tax=Lutibacter oricola TaxID=762486 RepID=A0A1H3CJA8_9FLAO|nr:tetratricopeptide repeat protein [Lutibacter oricola]SDX54166.1 TPR repeat-containing protein [Lutibacter oricola]
MRKQILVLSAIVMSMTVFGQKNELKTAEKAIKANNVEAALAAIGQAEGLIENADQKTKAKFYYLKGKALYNNGKVKNIGKTAAALKKLISFEKQTNKPKYSKEFKEIQGKLVQRFSTKANDSYKKAVETKSPDDYKAAAKGFHNIYVLSPRDTSYLDNAALLYSMAKDNKNAIKLYEQLLKKGYTGITTVYTAVSKADGKKVTYADKSSRDTQVKLKLASNPGKEVKESRKAMIYKNLASSYSADGNAEKAKEILAKGREEFPNDYILLIEQANLAFKAGNNAKFKELLEMAIELNPTEPSLYYNVGVMSLNQKDVEGAIANFKKAIELKPDYADAYNNVGAAILEKAEPIIEEMNKSLNDFDKYDKLQKEQFEVYKEAVPYYESAYKYDKSNIAIVQTLMGLYENLDMGDKLNEIKAVYEEMKQ